MTYFLWCFFVGNSVWGYGSGKIYYSYFVVDIKEHDVLYQVSDL